MTDDDSLWLVIQQGGKRVRCFELRANCHRAIAVGSARNAEFRVQGAPPVAFYLEREDAAVWATPAYIGDDLRVDTQKLEARRRLHRLSKVEFSSISLDLVIRDTPPTLRGNDVPTAAGDGTELDDAFRELEDGEPTDDEQLRTTRRLFLRCESHEGPAIEPQPTIEVSPQPAALRIDDPFGDSGRTNEYWPPRPLLVLKPEPPRLTMLAKLGLLTMRRPLAVLASAVVGTVVMSIFLVGAAEVVGRHARHRATNEELTQPKIAPTGMPPIRPGSTTCTEVDSAAGGQCRKSRYTIDASRLGVLGRTQESPESSRSRTAHPAP